VPNLNVHLHLNRPAHITEVAPHLLAPRAANLLGELRVFSMEVFDT
jgi:hypothetical protein